MGISVVGLQNAANRFSATAGEIVKATSPNLSQGSDLEKAEVAQISNTVSYKANATAVETANRMMGALLNVTA